MLTKIRGLPQNRQQRLDWEREVESLDQKEVELHQTQMKLIREQMTTFIRDLAGLKEAVDDMRLQREGETMQVQVLREELHRDRDDMQTEVMRLIEALQVDLQGHSTKLEEVAALVGDGIVEGCIARLHHAHEDTVQKHSNELATLRDVHDSQHASLRERMDYLERLLGDSVDKHAKEVEALKAAHEKHSTSLSKSAKFLDDHKVAVAGHHATLQKRVDEMLRSHMGKHGNAVDELRRSHSNLAKEQQELAVQHSIIEDRLKSMDKAFANSFDEHSRQMESLGAAHEKHLGAMSKHSKDLESLKADKQAQQDILLGRLEKLEQTHGEMHDRHASGVSSLDLKYQAMLDRLAGVEKQEYHIGNLQRSQESLAAKKAALESSHTSMGDRVGNLELWLGDFVEKHSKDLEQFRRSHESLHGRLASCEAHGPVLSELRSSHGGLAAQKEHLETHNASLKERVDYLEGVLNDSADKRTEQIHSAHAKLGEMEGRILACERRFGPSLLELERGHSEFYEFRSALDSDTASVKQRLDNMEALFGDTANRQTKELKSLKTLHDKHAVTLIRHAAQLEEFASQQQHHATLPERMAYVEQQLGESTDKHTAELAEFHEKLASEQTLREKHHGTIKDLIAHEQEEHNNHHVSLNERLDHLESVIGDNTDKHARELAQIVSGHHKLSGEVKSRGDGHGVLVDRIDKLEKVVAESTQRQAREVKATNAKFDDFHNRVSMVKEAWSQETPRTQ